jgi:hypothetical protein
VGQERGVVAQRHRTQDEAFRGQDMIHDRYLT